MVQNICKNSFSGGKSRKNGIPVIKSHLLCKKLPRMTGFYELTPKLQSVLAGLILYSCGV